MKYSIIVPLFNCEQYVGECLQSLAQQDYADFEIVVINDGSTDDSLAVAKTFEEKYDNLRIITQVNKGLSGARNTGIQQAKGEYLVFVDADDFVDTNLLSKVDKIIDDYEVVIYGYYVDIYKNHKFVSTDKKFLTEKTMELSARNMSPLEFSGLIGYAWNKVYKRQLIIENNIWFRERISLVEDILFNNEVLNYTDQIGIVREPLIHYIQRLERATLSNRKYTNLNKLLEQNFECKKNIMKRYFGGKYKTPLTPIFNFLFTFLLNYSEGTKMERCKICREFYQKYKDDININEISNPLIKISLKWGQYWLMVCIYDLKEKRGR